MSFVYPGINPGVSNRIAITAKFIRFATKVSHEDGFSCLRTPGNQNN
jgi:hypothetical protein